MMLLRKILGETTQIKLISALVNAQLSCAMLIALTKGLFTRVKLLHSKTEGFHEPHFS